MKLTSVVIDAEDGAVPAALKFYERACPDALFLQPRLLAIGSLRHLG